MWHRGARAAHVPPHTALALARCSGQDRTGCRAVPSPADGVPAAAKELRLPCAFASGLCRHMAVPGAVLGSRMRPVPLPPSRYTQHSTYTGGCGFPDPSSPCCWELWPFQRAGDMQGTLWGPVSGHMLVASWAAGGTPRLSAGLGLVGVLWGAGAPQIALQGSGCPREGHWRYHGGEGKVFFLALPS